MQEVPVSLALHRHSLLRKGICFGGSSGVRRDTCKECLSSSHSTDTLCWGQEIAPQGDIAQETLVEQGVGAQLLHKVFPLGALVEQ